MTSTPKILASVMDRSKSNNILFTDLQKLLDAFNFQHRIKGSHYIYWREGIDEIINIQPYGNKAKSYQVQQIRNIILKYSLNF